MSNNTRGWRITQLWCVMLVLLARSPGQAPPSTPVSASAMVARLVAGESVRYEFEGIVHIAAARAPDVTLNIPDDCSYTLRAVMKLDFGHASSDGGLDGQVRYQSIRYEGPRCAIPEKTDPIKALQELEKKGTGFSIKPAGDVHLERPAASAEFEGISVLRKAAWDLLQVRLTDGPVASGPRTVSTRRFLYWPDTFVEGMQVAGTSMQYRQDASVGGRPYAWLQYKQVISPADMPAYVETRSQARDFTGTTFVTGEGNISLLFDRAHQRIVYLRRQRKIDNRMTLKYELTETSRALATYSIEEESTVRWLPEKDSQAWLAELHQFENKPVDESRRKKSSTEAAARHEITELQDLAPKGFERWNKSYCVDPYCFEVSIAVPERTKSADQTDATALLLSGSGNNTVTIAIGPVLDHQYQNLADEELLQQQSTRFVGNYLWFAGRAGRKVNFEMSSVGDRPAAFTEFTATARDLTPIRGRLVMVIGPFDRLVPVTCSYAADQAALDAICQTVTASVVIR